MSITVKDFANTLKISDKALIERMQKAGLSHTKDTDKVTPSDKQALLKFLDDVEKNINPIPVVAGIWPLVSLRNAEFLKNEVPGVEIPDAILERMSKAKTKEEGRALGIDIAREIRDEISDRVAGFQVSAPFGIIDLALQVLD